jgi:pSer/pThr/pTyr-binding forkhead associated (FHA) protein
MSAHLEFWAGGDSRIVSLEFDHVSIGRAETNDIALPYDPTVSRLHAVIVRYRGGWCLRDVGSGNGTYLNGQRVLTEQLLRPDDEIRVGAARLVFRGEPNSGSGETVQEASRIPELTRREREVLTALCRPLLGAQTFAQPASALQIAAELHVEKATVQFHLVHLYDKFDIGAEEGSRRTRLANEAVSRGVVSRTDLRRDSVS